MLGNCFFGAMSECGGPSDAKSLPRQDCRGLFDPIAELFRPNWPLFQPRQDSIAYERPVVAKQWQTTTGKTGSWANPKNHLPHVPLFYAASRVLVWKVILYRGYLPRAKAFHRMWWVGSWKMIIRASGKPFSRGPSQARTQSKFALVCVTVKFSLVFVTIARKIIR